MRVLIVYAHPHAASFTSAVKDVVEDKARQTGAEVRVIDLYADCFDPVLNEDDFTTYQDQTCNQDKVRFQCEAVVWCDTLIFVYPTWWYGLPAILKGWLDRVLLPGVAFEMPTAEGDAIKPGLTHIKRLGVFTTCGASRWLTLFIGAPGKRTLFRGVGLICAKPLKKAFAAHYLMDSSTDTSRKNHLDRVAHTMERFLA